MNKMFPSLCRVGVGGGPPVTAARWTDPLAPLPPGEAENSSNTINTPNCPNTPIHYRFPTRPVLPRPPSQRLWLIAPPAAGPASASACCRRSCSRQLPSRVAGRHRIHGACRGDHGRARHRVAHPVPPPRRAVERRAAWSGRHIALAGASLLWLRDDPHAGRADVLFLLLTVWAGDIRRLFSRPMVRRTRLAPISPPVRRGRGRWGACSPRLQPGCSSPICCRSAPMPGARRWWRRFWGSLHKPAICWKASSSGAWR